MPSTCSFPTCTPTPALVLAAFKFDHDRSRANGAFRALAEIGLAIAGGEVLRFATKRADGRHSEGFLRSKGGSCDACTEAGIIARYAHELLGVAR